MLGAEVKDRAADLATLVLALVLAGLAHAASFVELAIAYGVAWLVVNAARAWSWPKEMPAVPRGLAVGALVFLLAVPLRELAARVHALAEHEGLTTLAAQLPDRHAHLALPAIAPPLVASDRPQTFFVRAEGEHVRVRLDESADWIEADALGHGVFRVDYDPILRGGPRAQAHRAIASLEVDGSVTERELLAATPLPHPRWPRLSPDLRRACIPDEELDEVLVVTLGAELALEHVAVLDGPTDCAIDDDGALVVAHRWSTELLRRDADDHRSRESQGGPGAVGLGHLHGRTFVLREGPSATLGSLALEGTPLFVASAPLGDGMIVATRSPAALVRVEEQEGALRITASRRLAVPPTFVALDDEGTRLVAALGDFAEDGQAGLGNHFVADRVATFDARTLALVEDHLTAFRTERQDHAGDVDRGAGPLGLFRTRRGTTWVAFGGTDEIEELGGPAPRVIDVGALGASVPYGVVELADGTLLVTSPSSGLILRLGADGTLRQRFALTFTDRELLSREPDALRLRFGERAFFEATRAGVSCHSCHPYGGTDGATHNIGGRVAAPTLDTRGLVGTSPFLRDGSYPRIADLMEVARLEYRGYREPAGDRGATIEAWLDTLPPPPTYVARDLPGERAGLDVFVRSGCPDCHAAPGFTSLGLHAIESIFPDAPRRGGVEGRSLDVPSLRSVAVSAPYLYDGRAATLEAVLGDANATDRHGHTRVLSATDRAHLVTFLRSL